MISFSGRVGSLWVHITALILCLVFSLPLLALFGQALYSAHPLPWDALSERTLYYLLGNSLVLVGLTSVLSTSLGFILAFFVFKTDVPGKKFWQLAFTLPLSIPSYIGAIVYSSLFAPKASLYQWTGYDLWNIYGMDGAVFILTLFTFPYSFLICRSQMKGMDPKWEEAAFDLGLSKGAVIFRILIPLYRPALVSAMLLIGLYVLSDFGAIALLRFNTFTTAIFYQLDSFNPEKASFLGAILLLISGGMVWWRDYNLRKNNHESFSGKSSPCLFSLKGGRWPVLIFMGGVFLLSVIVPLATLFSHMLSENIQWSPLWGTIRSSFFLAFSVALTVSTLGFFFCYGLKVWGRQWGPQCFQKIAFSLYGVPGILIALGTLFLARTFLGPFYGTILPLFLGLCACFFPQGLEAMNWGQKALRHNLVEASFDLNQSHWKTLKKVFFPLLKGTTGAAFLLIFISVLKELPTQLLLRPPGLKTLSVELWIYADEAFYPQASLYGLVIIFLAALTTPLILKRY